MTTVEVPTEPVIHQPPPNGRVTQWRVIAAERVKFFSLRSNPIALIGAIVAVIGFGLLAANVVTGRVVPDNPLNLESPDFSTLLDHVAVATSGVQMAVLILGTLGVLAMSGEYSSGMIRATLAAVPKRLPVLWGKISVMVTLTAVTMTVAVFGAFFISGGILSDLGLTASLGDHNVLRALFGNVGYIVGIVLIGLSLGVLLRSSAGGIATLFATLLIVPQLIMLVLPDHIGEVLFGYLPSNAALSFMVTDPRFALGAAFAGGGELLSPMGGALVFLGWVVVMVVAAAVTLKRRDA
jgi:ABC-2 type transport system permease protein